MFKGEIEGLKAINDTKTIAVPQVLATGQTDCGQHFLVMEYLKITKFRNSSFAELGRQLADMHLCNLNNTCGRYLFMNVFTIVIFKLCVC